jgi:hypothetical protein
VISPLAPSSSAMPCWSAVPAPERAILPSPLPAPGSAPERVSASIPRVDWSTGWKAEALARRQGRMAARLARLDFLTLDELGYLPFGQSRGELLLHLISPLDAEKRSLSPAISLSPNGLQLSAMPK